MHNEWTPQAVDTSVNLTTVNAVPTLLKGWYVNTVLSAHTVVIKDGTTAVFTIPASLAAGSKEMFDEGVQLLTSLIVDPDNSSTGNITMIYTDLERE